MNSHFNSDRAAPLILCAASGAVSGSVLSVLALRSCIAVLCLLAPARCPQARAEEQAPKLTAVPAASKNSSPPYEVYASKYPFEISIPRGSVDNGEFRLFADNTPGLILSATPTRDKSGIASETEKIVCLSIGFDFFTLFKYTGAIGRSPSVRDFVICGDYGQFSDFNVDGKWDERVLFISDPKVVRAQVSYGGEWRDTAPGDRYGVYTRNLKEGPAILFDMRRGVWVGKDMRTEDAGTNVEKKVKRPEREAKEHDGYENPREMTPVAPKAGERAKDARGLAHSGHRKRRLGDKAIARLKRRFTIEAPIHGPCAERCARQGGI